MTGKSRAGMVIWPASAPPLPGARYRRARQHGGTPSMARACTSLAARTPDSLAPSI